MTTTALANPWSTRECLNRLHPQLVDWMQSHQWREMRPMQLSAAQHLLTTDLPLLITANVASGKTEAAMLPILTKLAALETPGFGAVYVSPLIALINDQTERLNSLAEAVGLHATPWHGEVPVGVKVAARREPYGALLITPESLDSFVMRNPTEVPRFFGGLRYVIVDELHAFLGTERGQQLRSVLARIERILGRSLIPVGLSATLADVQAGQRWLASANPKSVQHIPDSSAPNRPLVDVRAVLASPASDAKPTRANRLNATAVVAAIGPLVRAGKHLVFANNRAEVEATADGLRQIWLAPAFPGCVHVHHSSIARQGRNDAEEALRTQDHVVAVCTSTLELGVDVPHVASVVQIGAPHCVSALKQRAGRTGRRGVPGQLRVLVTQFPTDPRMGVLARLRIDLIQAIAITELVLAGWFESPPTGMLHLSVLVHQVLTLLRQVGGMAPTKLWEALCRDGAFANINAGLFRTLLGQLRREGLIVQDVDTAVIRLDMKGEDRTTHYTFPVLFNVPQEWSLITGDRLLGSLPCSSPLLVGDQVVFGGRRWEATMVEDQAHRITVKPSKAGAIPEFEGGAPGMVADRVREQMRNLLAGSHIPEFIDPTARQLLTEARTQFNRLSLGSIATFDDGCDTLLFHWQGDRSASTLRLLLQQSGLSVAEEGPALRVFRTRAAELNEVLSSLAGLPKPDPLTLARSVCNKRTHKYDCFLGEELLSLDYASRAIDVAGAIGIAAAIAAQ
jgi:ATP-dependent Lhr-like helicase